MFTLPFTFLHVVTLLLLWACLVLGELFLFQLLSRFFSSSSSVFFFFFASKIWIMKCLDVDLFELSLLGFYWASWICMNIFFQIWKVSVIISQRFSCPFFPFFLSLSLCNMLVHLIMPPQIPGPYSFFCIFFFFFFILDILNLALYHPVYWFFHLYMQKKYIVEPL